MKIIPAIDIINGKCVRLYKGDYNFKKEYPKTPLEVAQEIEAAGLDDLHLIDLEGAKVGKVVNWQVIKDIAGHTKLCIEMGGGVRSKQDASQLFSLGVDRIMLGSLAVEHPDVLADFLKDFGNEKIVVDIGFKNNGVYYKGWQERADKDFARFLRELSVMGVSRILLTDVEKDGALEGPNFSLYVKVKSDFPEFLVTASGGVSTKDDLLKLKATGVWGAVVGKALHEGRLSLNDLKNYDQ